MGYVHPFDACYLTLHSLRIIRLLGVLPQFFNRLLCPINYRKGKTKHRGANSCRVHAYFDNQLRAQGREILAFQERRL